MGIPTPRERLYTSPSLYFSISAKKSANKALIFSVEVASESFGQASWVPAHDHSSELGRALLVTNRLSELDRGNCFAFPEGMSSSVSFAVFEAGS